MIKTLLLLTGLALVQARANGDAVVNNARLYEPHEDCPDEEVHYLLPHEYDCTMFYYCAYGLKYVEPRSCAPGTEFDPKVQVCVHAGSSGCTLPGPGSTAAPTAGPTAATAAPTTAATAAPTTAPTAAPTAAPTVAPTAAPTSGPGNPDDCETLANGCPADFTIHKLIPHEEYCHLFYYCDKGELVLKSCPEPLYFHPRLGCVWPRDSDCVNDGPYTYPTTVAPENGTTPGDIGDVLDNGCPADFNIQHLLPHEECEKYYQCNNGLKIERDCQPGTVFNFPAQYCDWPYNVPQCAGSPGATARPTAAPDSEEIPLPNDPDNDWEALPNGCPADFEIDHLLPHESDCNKYYACANGGLVEMKCPPRLHFSLSQQICTWPHEAGCEHWVCNPEDNDGNCTDPTTDADIISTAPSTTSRPTDSSEDTQNPADPGLPGEWESLPNGCPADFDIDYLLPHEYDCEKFYYCVHGEKVEFSCAPNGTHFSPTLQKCTWPEEAGCEHWDGPDNITTSATEDTPPSPTSSDPDITTTTDADITTTIDPDCPECSDDPADKCKESCNVAPWPHPECDKFYFCIGDQSRLGICAEGLHFNPRTLTCDFICNAGCVRNVPQITRHEDGLLMFLPNTWVRTAEVIDRIESELNAEL